MIEKFEQLIAIFLDQGRVDIRSRVLRLVLAGTLLTFVAMGLLSLVGILSMWFIVDIRGQALGENTADYAESFATREVKLELSRENSLRAALIDEVLGEIKFDVGFLSDEVTYILSAPEEYKPRILPNALYEIVETRTPYVHYSPELAKRGVTDEMRREIELVSNVADDFEDVATRNPCVVVVSKDGYVIKMDVMPSNMLITSLSMEPSRSTYDARECEWYRVGAAVEEPTFTDVYIANMTGAPCITCAMPYYDCAGDFAGVVGIDINADEIYARISKSTIGSTSFCFIMNATGEVLYSTQAEGDFVTGVNLLDKNAGSEIKSLGRLMTAGVPGVMEIVSEGESYYAAYAPMESAGWILATVLKKSEVMEMIQPARDNVFNQIDAFKESFGQLFLSLLVAGILLFCGVIYGLIRMSTAMATRFVEPIQQLSDGVREITSGNFERKLKIETGDEIEHLAVCFNAMTAELQAYMKNLTKETADNERIATELDVATEIQQSILPRGFDFGRTDFEIHATMEAAKEVGGDFYDFYLIDENHLMVTMADVSGKGVPAALFMMVSKTILKNFAMTMTVTDGVGELVTRANNQLCQNNDTMMFVTVFIALIDLKTGRMTYVNGAHNPPLIYRAMKDRFEYLDTSARNYALGLMEEVDYVQEAVELSAGDIIYLYTDGVTEALNVSEELFGELRLEQCLNRLKVKQMSVEDILLAVRRELDEFVSGAQQSDDITMLAVKFRG